VLKLMAAVDESIPVPERQLVSDVQMRGGILSFERGWCAVVCMWGTSRPKSCLHGMFLYTCC
jgi:hypothetical protein